MRERALCVVFPLVASGVSSAAQSGSGPGFATVRIEPHLGTLDQLDAALPHPRGSISVSYRRE